MNHFPFIIDCTRFVRPVVRVHVQLRSGLVAACRAWQWGICFTSCRASDVAFEVGFEVVGVVKYPVTLIARIVFGPPVVTHFQSHVFDYVDLVLKSEMVVFAYPFDCLVIVFGCC